jgi:diguanylate cyclase (GGDEF)-like protein
MKNMTMMQLGLTAIVLSSIVGGAVNILGPVRLVAMIFITCLSVPFALLGFTLNIEGMYEISSLGLVFWLVMMTSANKLSVFVSMTLKLQQDNASLLTQIQEEKHALQNSHDTLKEVNSKLDKYSDHLQDEVNKRTDEIYRISNLDSLTQLLNRSALLNSINQTFSRAHLEDKHFTLFFIDLNGFKGINDSFGHAHGDSVLKVISSRLSKFAKQQCLGTNSFLGRWGGDEFILIYESKKDEIKASQQAFLLASEISKNINQAISIDVDSVIVDSSIGIAHYPLNSMDPLELIQFADLAMYDTKNSISNLPQQYSSSILACYAREQRLRKALYAAIKNDEFHMVFQPIIDATNDTTYGFETLLRWSHCDELIGPDEFIPIAEKTGLIKSIGHWVIEHSLAEFMKIENYHDYHLSINLSRIQLLDEQAVTSIVQMINISPIAKSHLHFEITETSSIEDQEKFTKNLTRISRTGVCISIDDFGTGYSSLQELQRLAFDIVKVDRSFIQDLNNQDIAIVTAAGFIAKQFDANVIIEGVETTKQLKILKRLGFRYLQGYLFAKPMRIEALHDWLQVSLEEAYRPEGGDKPALQAVL